MDIPQEQPTVTVSLSATVRERLSYIQEATGSKSRSGVVVMAVNELYDRLVNQAHVRLERKMKQ